MALGIRVPDQDPVATARGNAFVATADNPAAIYYNPAGISQLDGQNASLGVYGISMGSEFENGGTTIDSKNRVQALPQVYYTAKCPKYPLTFGLGLYSPYGLGLEWPDTAPFSALAKRGEIAYATLNPVVAWEIIPNLSVAMGPTLNYAQMDLETAPAGPGSKFRFRGRDIDVGYNAGIFWKPLEQHAFGVSYRSPTQMNFDGHATTEVPAFGFQNTENGNAGFRFPRNIVFGYSFRPTPAWNLEFDADWTDWDNLNSVTLNKASGNQTIPFNWASSWFYEFGATRYFENGWSVSGGYIFSENSVPDSSFNPLVPDSDRHIFSLGVGKQYKKIGWNAAYQLAWGPSRTIDNVGAFNSSANGSYEFLSHAFTLSLNFRL